MSNWKYTDLTGREFVRWRVLSEAEPHINKNGSKVRRWLCQCSCGTERIVRQTTLIQGVTTSCGCLHREIMQAHTKHGHSSSRSGVPRGTPEYTSWCKMMTRCNCPTSDAWAYYGGRGIKVCPQWSSFEQFLADMGPRPSLAHSLERLNNEGGYEPGNCVWADRRRQMRNTRGNHMITFQNETRPLIEWAEKFGIHPKTIVSRLETGWTIERALSQPVSKSASQRTTEGWETRRSRQSTNKESEQ